MIDRTKKRHIKELKIKFLSQDQKHPLAAKDQAALDSVKFLQNNNLYQAIVMYLKLKDPE